MDNYRIQIQEKLCRSFPFSPCKFAPWPKENQFSYASISPRTTIKTLAKNLSVLPSDPGQNLVLTIILKPSLKLASSVF